MRTAAICFAIVASIAAIGAAAKPDAGLLVAYDGGARFTTTGTAVAFGAGWGGSRNYLVMRNHDAEVARCSPTDAGCVECTAHICPGDAGSCRAPVLTYFVNQYHWRGVIDGGPRAVEPCP